MPRKDDPRALAVAEALARRQYDADFDTLPAEVQKAAIHYRMGTAYEFLAMLRAATGDNRQ
jgi:hypothetical protein